MRLLALTVALSLPLFATPPKKAVFTFLGSFRQAVTPSSAMSASSEIASAIPSTSAIPSGESSSARTLTVNENTAFQENLKCTHSCPKQALYLVHKGQIDAALDLYLSFYQSSKTHDTEFLQQLGISLLEQGSRNSDPEIQLMAIFGAGISMNERVIPILGRALNSPVPLLQILALNFLSRNQTDDADRYVLRALQSNFLIVRLEALHQIALKKHLKASSHIESLMGKVDTSLLPLFPQLFALVNDTDSVKNLRKFLSHHEDDVRIEAIISSAKCGRDDLLPKIRSLASHHLPAQQEASALALGELHDEASVEILSRLSRDPKTMLNVRLAALKSLYTMGRTEALWDIQHYAKNGDLFAIALLGELHGAEETLYTLSQSSDFAIRLNASIALLKRQDVRCLPLLSDILLKDSRDFAFTKIVSRGKGLSYWKPVASARQQFGESQVELEISLHLRESLLEDVLELPEEHFLAIVTQIFDRQQNDLVPSAIELLEILQTPKAIQLLKTHQQRPGAPLVRNYCNLALYRLGEEGPYADNLASWMNQQAKETLIQLRPFVPWELDDERTVYQITPHETSRLLVETFEAMTKKQDNKGIDCLLKAIKDGNNKNKFALAGLLIHATL